MKNSITGKKKRKDWEWYAKPSSLAPEMGRQISKFTLQITESFVLRYHNLLIFIIIFRIIIFNYINLEWIFY